MIAIRLPAVSSFRLRLPAAPASPRWRAVRWYGGWFACGLLTGAAIDLGLRLAA